MLARHLKNGWGRRAHALPLFARLDPDVTGLPLWLSIATFATVLARGFLDFGYVFRQFTDMSASAIAAPMVGHVVFYTLWLWAFLTAVRGSRGGAIAILAFDALQVGRPRRRADDRGSARKLSAPAGGV